MSEQCDRLAELVAEKLADRKDELAIAWRDSKPVRHLIVDDLFPAEIAARISKSFPSSADLMKRSSLRERKWVGVQVEKYDPIIADALYAFQRPIVANIVGEITGIPGLIADPSLYAGGISVMDKDDFLNPHVDNSHDGEQQLYRAVNLLYYTPVGWNEEDGGHLELWDRSVRDRVTVACRFNRLAIMETNRTSWHSVCKIRTDRARQCVSNYFFTESAPGGVPYKHVTTFTGRPEEPLKRMILWSLDSVALNTVGRMFPGLLKRTPHRRKMSK